MGWSGYGENIWGLTACDGPPATQQDYDGKTRAFRTTPRAAPGSPTRSTTARSRRPPRRLRCRSRRKSSIPAIEEMHERYGDADLFARTASSTRSTRASPTTCRSSTGTSCPGVGWVASDYLGIDQGPILAMIENYRDDFVWNVMRKNPYIRRGLQRAGFTGGWLEPTVAGSDSTAAGAP